MIQISRSPWAIREMFQAYALKRDDTWMPVGTNGHAPQLMFDTTHGCWVSILPARGLGTNFAKSLCTCRVDATEQLADKRSGPRNQTFIVYAKRYSSGARIDQRPCRRNEAVFG